MGTLEAVWKRCKTAVSLAVDFVSLKVMILGAIPVVLWLLKKLTITWRKAPASDLFLLVASYVIVWLGIVVWKFSEAGWPCAERGISD
jgi:hypothetical protein